MQVGLHWVDYVIMALFLSISLAIGIYHSRSGGGQRTPAEFILANRKLMVIPTVLSMVMSFMSAITIIGATAEVYDYGTMPMLWNLPGNIIGDCFIALVLVPWLYPLKLVSVFDYLELRFRSRSVRYVGAIIGIIHAILYNGISMFAPSIALESVTGLSVMISLPVLALVGTAYTAMGGMRAVIWTDVFQGLVLIAGVIAVLIKGLILSGGPETIIQEGTTHGRLFFNEFSFDPRVRNTALNLICNAVTMIIFMRGLCQASVQRYSSTKNMSSARKTILGNAIVSPLLVFVSSIIGITVFAFYAKEQCDPLISGMADVSNKVLSIFVSMAFQNNIGFSGIFIATLYSGALSSLSSNLSGCAANIWEDILKPFIGHRFSDYRAAQLNKVLVVIVGALSLGLACLCNAIPGTMFQLCGMFFGVCGGPMIGLYLLGGVFRFTNYVGAITGVLTSFAFVGWVSIGSQNVAKFSPALPPISVNGCATFFNGSIIPEVNYTTLPHYQHGGDLAQNIVDSIYQISFNLYGIIGVVITMAVGMSVSAIANCVSKQVRVDNSSVPDKYFIQWRNAFRNPPDGHNYDSKADYITEKAPPSESEESEESASNLLDHSQPI